jgi:2-C-methyl-D-erythritol 2,4-cyclodiphosphate synthase
VTLAPVGIRVGSGIDVHRLVRGRALVLGGVTIPSEFGLDGHSDADVLTHALMDALLGAMGEPDIGFYFPPSDNQWKDAYSIDLLKQVGDLVSRKGYIVGNADCTLILEEPKIAPYRERIRSNFAEALLASPDCFSVKATTAENLGAIGHGEGAVAFVSVLLLRRELI